MIDSPLDGRAARTARNTLEQQAAFSGWCARIERAAILSLSHPSVVRLTQGAGQVRWNELLVKSPAAKMQVFARDGYRCVACDAQAEYFAVERDADNRAHAFFTLQLYARTRLGQSVVMTLDHVLPRARGGGDEAANLQSMCRPCNQAKGDRIEPRGNAARPEGVESRGARSAATESPARRTSRRGRYAAAAR